MSVVTITTDFGIADYASGLLQGVVWGIAPGADIVVLSHDIPRHDVHSGALLLERSMPYFPPDTVHIMVVDPGVGTQRRGIAARLGSQYFVGPDNGLITRALRRCSQQQEPVYIVHLNKPEYWNKDVSNVFHGRDIFAPVGAYLSNGIPLKELGDEITNPTLFDLPSPIQHLNGITGQIITVDHFGNLSTNVRGEQTSGINKLRIMVGDRTIHNLTKTFGNGQPGDLVAVYDSSGYLAICVVNGNAAQTLGLACGDEVSVIWDDEHL